MGLWLSRPRVHDKVAVVSVISSTITTPGGPGGPGEKEAAPERKNEHLKEERSVSLFESKMYFRCPPFVAALRYTNEYIRSDVSLPAEGESITSLLIFAQANTQTNWTRTQRTKQRRDLG